LLHELGVRAPTGVEPPIGIVNGAAPASSSSSVSTSRAISNSPHALSPAPVKCSCAPNNDDSSWLPTGTSGRSPESTRCTSSPSTAPAAAVMRQWFDWAAPTVTSDRAPAACAAPHKNSNLRALLPPMPSPVRSSRLTHSRTSPGSSGPRSSGVGNVASRARGR
jgi:hypothetical protein